MIVKWKITVSNEGAFAVLLTGLSKTLYFISHDLIIVKISVYGFDTNALKFINNYLSSRKQRAKVNNVYSI